MNFDETVKALQKPGVQMSVSLAVANAPHSFEFGPASQRHKIYYSDLSELKARIQDALDAEEYYKKIIDNRGADGNE